MLVLGSVVNIYLKRVRPPLLLSGRPGGGFSLPPAADGDVEASLPMIHFPTFISELRVNPVFRNVGGDKESNARMELLPLQVFKDQRRRYGTHCLSQVQQEFNYPD